MYANTHLFGSVPVGQFHLSEHLSPLLHDEGSLIGVVRDLVIRLWGGEERKGEEGGGENGKGKRERECSKDRTR